MVRLTIGDNLAGDIVRAIVCRLYPEVEVVNIPKGDIPPALELDGKAYMGVNYILDTIMEGHTELLLILSELQNLGRNGSTPFTWFNIGYDRGFAEGGASGWNQGYNMGLVRGHDAGTEESKKILDTDRKVEYSNNTGDKKITYNQNNYPWMLMD